MRFLFCSFLFLPILVFSQKEVNKDSVWISNIGGTFFENRRVEYSDNTYTESNTPIGDTIQLLTRAKRSVFEQGENMANDVAIVSKYSGRISELIRQANAVEALVGQTFKYDSLTTIFTNPLKAIAAEKLAELTKRNWMIGTDAIVFSVNAQGQARYQVGTQPVRNCSILGNTIRLNNYLGGASLDLFRITNRKYINLDGSIKMLK